MSEPPPHIDNDRADLSRIQAALVGALHDDAPAPEGFDRHQLESTAQSLARKRSRSVQKSWPAATASLGETFTFFFESYSRQYPSPPENPFRDGLQFVQWLDRGHALPPEGRLELGRWRVSRSYLPRLLWLPGDRTLAILLRVGRHVRTFHLRLWPAS